MKKIVYIVMAVLLLLTTVSCGKTEDGKIDYTQFEGLYSDEFSGRAEAEVTNEGDRANVKVYWGSSGDQTLWAMTATFDGEKLSYTDCRKENITVDENGDTYETVYENGSGYFLWQDGKLVWSGASEEECRDCIFVKYTNKPE